MTQPTDTASTATGTAVVSDAAAAVDASTAAAQAANGNSTTTTADQATAAQAEHPWADPAKAQAEIERLRRENAAARTNAKQQAADEARQTLAQQIGKALGLVKDDEPADPAQLTEQLTSTAAEAKQAKLELAVFRAASTAGANATALLDSRSFLSKIESLDAADTDGITAAITAAIQNDPRLKATPGAAPVGGAQQVSGGSAPARIYTRDQLRDPEFFAANRADILRAQSEGRIRG